MKSLYPEIREQLRSALYDDRLSPAAAGLRLGLGDRVYHYIARIEAEFGTLPPCGCGRPGKHPGTCRARIDLTDRPECPGCASKVVKRAGRNRNRQQVWICCDCSRNFVRFARQQPAYKDFEHRLHRMIYENRWKCEAIAAELHISMTTVRAWYQRLKRKHGAVSRCDCGRAGFHSGACFVHHKAHPDTARLDWLLRQPEIRARYGTRQDLDRYVTGAKEPKEMAA